MSEDFSTRSFDIRLADSAELARSGGDKVFYVRRKTDRNIYCGIFAITAHLSGRYSGTESQPVRKV